MKFDPFTWDEVPTDEQIHHRKGWLRLHLSQPGALYIEAEGVEALAGYGATFAVEVSEAVNFRVDAPQGTRAFLRQPEATTTVVEGEVFTNIDRMPHESGAVAEVTRALRMFKIERQSLLRDIRTERSALERARTPAPDPVQVIEEDPAPEADADETEAKA